MHALETARATQTATLGAQTTQAAAHGQRISPQLAGSCRFEPSCSEFAVQAITVHGAVRGSRLTAARVLRCRPGGRRGPDPVPDAE